MEADLRTVITRMVASLRRGEDRAYHVAIVGYFIEGVPVPSTGLAVDQSGTENIQETEEGFSCQAYFHPQQLYPAIVRRNGTMQKNFGDGPIPMVTVNLEVRRRDIFAVAEFIEGTQHDLFQNVEVFLQRHDAFREEADAWLSEHAAELR